MHDSLSGEHHGNSARCYHLSGSLGANLKVPLKIESTSCSTQHFS